MIITKTPFRISFAGGGSDLPEFYREHGGCVLSTSINRYMYIMIHPYFDEKKTSLKYSQTEIVDHLEDINHSIFRCVLNQKKISGVEISSTADVPSGTGLGSSSSFTVGLLHTLYCFTGKYCSKAELAKEACQVEIEYLGNPIGKQDQYAAAFGGLNFTSFYPDDTVSVEPIIMKNHVMKMLQDNLVVFYTGVTHNANKILSGQKKEISKPEKVEQLKAMCGLARDMKASLEKNELNEFGKMLHEGWKRKRELSDGITNSKIDDLYELGIKSGATGGKLLGAGGGGFLLFYCPKEEQPRLEKAIPLKRFDFSFEHDGTSVVYIGDKYWR